MSGIVGGGRKKMRPWKKGMRGKIKTYRWMGMTIHLMNSGIKEKVRKIVS